MSRIVVDLRNTKQLEVTKYHCVNCCYSAIAQLSC